MAVPPDGTNVSRLMSLATPNCGNANQPPIAKLVASRSEPMERHCTLLLLLAACAVTVIWNQPAPTLVNGKYQYFPWLQLFWIVGPLSPQQLGSLTGQSFFPPRAGRLPASVGPGDPATTAPMIAITERH